jgi:hypothetical protein
MASTIATVSTTKANGPRVARVVVHALPAHGPTMVPEALLVETAAGWAPTTSRANLTRAQRGDGVWHTTTRPTLTGSKEHHDCHVSRGAFTGVNNAPWSARRGT